MNAATTDTQQRILDAARDLIYARSYADVGVAEICERAGVQKGSFYHFFPSKRDLTLAVLDEHYVAFKGNLLDHAFAPDIPPLARVERFARMYYDFQKHIVQDCGRVLGCPVGNLANELASHDEAIRLKIDGLFTRFRLALKSLLKEAQQSGEVADIDIEATAQAMLAYMEGVVLLAKTQNDPEVLRQLLPAMAAIRIPKT